MDLKIRRIGTSDGDLYVNYMIGLDFGHSPHWATCFCRYYHLSCSMEEWQARSGETNKADALQAIAAGNMNGYLAFDGDKCIGWCNANDLSAYPRLTDEIAKYHSDRTGSYGMTVCFVIHPDYRNKRVARRMLEQIVDDYRQAGYAGMLAMPYELKEYPEKRYRGTKRMYEELGYIAIAEDGPATVMRLEFANKNI